MPTRVLAIEDDSAIVELLVYHLEAAGYEVHSATTAEEGEMLLAEQEFDLVVLD